MKYAIVIESGENNYSAYVPDLPGCIAVGDTLEEIKRMMQEAIEFHVEGMMLHGETVPPGTSRCCHLDIDLTQIEKRVQRMTRSSKARVKN